jgi:hypothetical protein
LVTSDPDGDEGEREPTPEEANIRWLLAAVLHHEPRQPGGGEIDTSRSGGSQPPSA